MNDCLPFAFRTHIRSQFINKMNEAAATAKELTSVGLFQFSDGLGSRPPQCLNKAALTQTEIFYIMHSRICNFRLDATIIISTIDYV